MTALDQNGEARSGSSGAPFWLATSSSFVLWAKSGSRAAARRRSCPSRGAFLVWRARERVNAASPDRDEARDRKHYLYAGLIMGAACMTRPELHLMAILVGPPARVDAVRRAEGHPRAVLYVAGILAVTVPCHTFRYLYYGSLVPNTFYVKTGSGTSVWHEGLQAPCATCSRSTTRACSWWSRRWRSRTGGTASRRSTMAIIAVAFMVFYVKVGVDEMQWHRLYLPALPFLCVLAALGAQNLVGASSWGPGRDGEGASARSWATLVGWGAVLIAAARRTSSSPTRR